MAKVYCVGDWARMLGLLSAAVLVVLATFSPAAGAQRALVPSPVELRASEGGFHLGNETIGVAEGEAAAEVRAREVAFARTMHDRDFEAFLTFLAPEAIFFTGNTPLRGADAVGEAWAPFFDGETAPFSWSPDVVEVLDSGTLALSSGPVRDPSGEVVGRFNSIWRKDSDGVWRVVFDKGS